MSPHANKNGFTLVEVLVVMVLVLAVVVLTTSSFTAVLMQSARLFRSEESNIEGVLGLEVLRHDLSQAGYGLATEAASFSYTGEAETGSSSALNDSPYGPARPVAALERAGSGCESTTSDRPDSQGYTLLACSDYLALKGTNLGSAAAAKRWTFLNISSVDSAPVAWNNAGHAPAVSDNVVVLGGVASSTKLTHTLQQNVPDGKFYFAYSPTGFASFNGMSFSSLAIYGVGPAGTPLRMPFNRVDYFVATPPVDVTQPAARCAPGTGMLYKAELKQASGLLDYQPVLDCVANLQVVFGWDSDGDGLIDTWSNADGSVASGAATAGSIKTALSATTTGGSPNLSADGTGLSIRSALKLVKLYLLVQDGRKEAGYTSPSPIVVGEDSESSLTYSVDVAGNGWSNYRWKLYRVVIAPKNIQANQ